jgi:hypothetical protein
VIIPKGFTQSILPAEERMFDPNYVEPEPIKIEVYANPSRLTSAGVVKAIVDEFVSRVEERRTSSMTALVQLMSNGLLNPQNAESEARRLFDNVEESEATAITLKKNQEGAEAVEFDILAYMAPGMASFVTPFRMADVRSWPNAPKGLCHAC